MIKKNINIAIVFGLLLAVISCSASNSIELKLICTDGVKSIKVSKDINEIELLFFDIIDIQGIEKLENLNKIGLGFVSSYPNLNYLQKIKNLEYVIIINSRIKNLEFLHPLSQLKILYITGTKFNELAQIDLKGNNKLEYLSISYSYLTEIPKFYNIPKSLTMIDLSGNEIDKITVDFIETAKELKYTNLEYNRITGLSNKYKSKDPQKYLDIINKEILNSYSHDDRP